LLAPTKLFKLLTPFGGVDPAGPGFVVSPHKQKFTKQTHPEEQLLFAVPHPIISADTLIWWGGPCGAPGWSELPKIKFYQANPPQGATFVCWAPPYSHCKHLYLVE